jgi:hypothetical protein
MSEYKEVIEMVSVETDKNNDIVFNVKGTFTLENGQLTVQPNPESVRLFMNLVGETAYRYEKGVIGGEIIGEVYVEEDPVFWFRALPYTFHGTYFFARIPKVVKQQLELDLQ